MSITQVHIRVSRIIMLHNITMISIKAISQGNNIKIKGSRILLLIIMDSNCSKIEEVYRTLMRTMLNSTTIILMGS